MRDDQLDASLRQPFPQRVAVVGFVSDYVLGASAWSSGTELADADHLKGDLRELDLRRGRRVQVNSERSTPAINQYHKFRSLPSLGLSDFKAPFFALKKVPSMKHSFQRMCWRSLSWLRKARQRFSSVPLRVQRA